MKRIKLFSLNGFMDDVEGMLDKLDENYNDNIQWIKDCVFEVKNRRESSGPAVPITPMGRPRTRNYMKNRALQIERANRNNSSLKLNSTPKFGKVAINVAPHYLKKSASLKKKLVVRAAKNSGKAKKTTQAAVKEVKDPVRVNLFKSAFPKGKDPTEDAAANKEAVQEANQNVRKTRRAPTKATTASKVVKKPGVGKGRHKPQIADHLKDNLEFLVDEIMSPTHSKLNEAPQGVGFKSPVKVVKSKIDTGLEQIKEAKRKKKDEEAKKLPVVVEQNSENVAKDEDSELREVCDKSLQVTLPPMLESYVVPKELNPCVRLVDIGAGLTNAALTNGAKDFTTPLVKSFKLNNIPRKSTPLSNAERLKNSEKVPNIFYSTPSSNNHLKPLIVLEKLDLTRISTGNSPPGKALDNSDTSFNLQGLAKHSVIVIDESVQVESITAPKMETGAMLQALKSNSSSSAVRKSFKNAKGKLDQMDDIASVPQNKLKIKIITKPALLPTPNVAPQAVAKDLRIVNPAWTANNNNNNNNNAAPMKNVDLKRSRIEEEEEEEESSFEVTPVKKKKKFLPSTANDYNIRDLDSGDSTDDEYRPRKVIPDWARTHNLRPWLEQQARISFSEVHKLFDSKVYENLDLRVVFVNSKKHKIDRRTSSACWEHTPAKKFRH